MCSSREMTSKKWVKTREDSKDNEAIQIARGLYTSKVAVDRPPSFAQCGVYNLGNKRPLSAKSLRSRPRSAKARISTEKQSSYKHDEGELLKPPWRPFSGQASLSSKLNKKTGDSPSVLILNEGNNSLQKKFATTLDESSRHLPSGIASLQRWLTADIPSNWCGIDPQIDFVFLPCLSSINADELPIVPGPQSSNEELVFSPNPEPWKYRPPPKSVFWKYLKTKNCSDSNHRNIMDAEIGEDSRLINQLAKLGITQESGPQLRTAEVIRREIRDLENLLKGIGNPNSSSIISQYQYEITLLRKAAKETVSDCVLPCLDERQESQLQEEYTRFADEHTEILKAIRERRDKCIRELAALEKKLMNS